MKTFLVCYVNDNAGNEPASIMAITASKRQSTAITVLKATTARERINPGDVNFFSWNDE